MRRISWVGTCVVLGFLVATPSVAHDPSVLGLLGTFGVEPTVGKAVNDHQRLALYHEEQAQLNRSQAQNWEFAADYYEKNPAGFAGNFTAAEHAAHCRAIAEDFRKLEKLNEELATKNAP